VTPGGLDEAVMELYTRSGIPVFRDTVTLFDSLQCYYATRSPKNVLSAANGAGPRVGLARAGELLEAAAARRQTLLSELESSEILRSAGVPFVASTVARSAADAVAAAESAGFPVVLKALAPTSRTRTSSASSSPASRTQKGYGANGTLWKRVLPRPVTLGRMSRLSCSRCLPLKPN